MGEAELRSRETAVGRQEKTGIGLVRRVGAGLLVIAGLLVADRVHAQAVPASWRPGSLEVTAPEPRPLPTGTKTPAPTYTVQFAQAGATGKSSGTGAGGTPPFGYVPTRSKGSDEDVDFTIETEMPGPDRQFRRESEADVFERIRQDAKRKPGANKLIFPKEPVISTETYAGRDFPPMIESVEPGYVIHGRTYFEQRNFDRAGWDLGPISPLVCASLFYYDVALLPYHACTRPFECWDSSAGKCLPGDPTPLLCYKEQFSVTGLLGEASVIAGGFFVFP